MLKVIHELQNLCLVQVGFGVLEFLSNVLVRNLNQIVNSISSDE